jgi:formate dehydrogenase subunit delta
METNVMQNSNLTRMGNQIATFFASMPDREEALLDLATHLRKFWEPRMRRAFLDEFDSGHVGSMHPLLVTAVQQHRTLIE